MNDNASSPAGLGPTDSGRADDHPERAGGRSQSYLEAALEILEGSNKFEAQEARKLIRLALEEGQAGAPG